MFGDTEESKNFYKTDVFPRASDKFGIKVKDLEETEINPTTLLLSFLRQCKIKISTLEESPEIVLSKLNCSEMPFGTSDELVVEIRARINGYRVQNFTIVPDLRVKS
jgi:hypothetical protein